MSVLFEPFTIGNLTAKNRFLRSATYFGLADERGRVGEASADLMRSLAINQVGLIVTGYAFVSRSGRVMADMNGIDNDGQIPGYKQMTRAVHDEGGSIVMQIAHGGSASHAAVAQGFPRLLVSELAPGDKAPAGPLLLNDDLIEEIIEDFGSAAARVQEAGFDGVQIHGAHGYLVSQFLSPHINRRNDKWGGSLENRMRFALEVVRAIKANVGGDFPVMIKLGCHDYLADDAGMAIAEGAAIAQCLEAEGISLIEVSHGIADKSYRKLSQGKESRPIPEAYLVPDAEVVRRSTQVPLAVVGGMRSLPVMEGVIQSGAADMIALCRPLIRQPDIIKKWQSGYCESADCVSCAACIRIDKLGGADIECRELNKKPKSTARVA